MIYNLPFSLFQLARDRFDLFTFNRSVTDTAAIGSQKSNEETKQIEKILK